MLNHFRAVARMVCIITAQVVCLSAPTFGQFPRGAPTPDSLVKLLGSPTWQVRDDAVAWLNRVPTRQLPSNYAAVIIPLFEREATSLRPDPAAAGEGYGEYLLHLMEGVLRLHDPRSLRGLALVGIRMSREAQEYVASQGPASFPFLDEARSRGDAHVAIVWAYMLGQYGQKLSRTDSLQVMVRLFAVLPDHPRDFTWAAASGPLPEMVPLVEDIAARDPYQIGQRQSADVAAKLRLLRDRLSSPGLLARLSDWLDALCLSADGARRTACQTLGASLAEARTQAQTGRPGAARPALDTLIRNADEALTAHSLTEAEHRLLVANAEYLKGRP